MHAEQVKEHVAGAVSKADTGLEERRDEQAALYPSMIQPEHEAFEVAEATEVAPPASIPIAIVVTETAYGIV